ncbi:MAG: 5-formyltetrahydrofolate cyclo-ligase [Roseburia sp.]|nr:5-formyltetrahydrofolate cyclo-ligase [Roseburia sp.]MCM1279214.1 5-formyltetrahydrofolate cyclo-ligase [Robinsoniella sp.]
MIKAMQEEKKALRRGILKKRDEMSLEEQLTLSHEIMEKAVAHHTFLQAEEILTYVNYKSEVNTKGIIEYAFLLGKKVYCPKVTADGEMEFFEISSIGDLQEGYKGILEPDRILERQWKYSLKKALLIMPGAVFDRQGHRIGYGKGFYDRFLEKAAEHLETKAALAYEMQVQKEIPFEQHDKCVDMIITEQEVIDCL